jgi:hypothetical protein
MTNFKKMAILLAEEGYDEDIDWNGLYRWDNIYIRLNCTTGEPEDCYILPGAVRFRQEVWDIENNLFKMERDFEYFYAEWKKLPKD